MGFHRKTKRDLLRDPEIEGNCFMGIILGIDVGGSTTKIVGLSPDKKLIATLQVKATDQVTSMYGALGHFLSQNGFLLGDVSQVVLTGVGASFFSDNIFSLPTAKISEFDAIGSGGLFVAGIDEAIVVSMGTGTAFIRADKTKAEHIGGSGVGGGTLLGLSLLTTGKRDFDAVLDLAAQGSIRNVDLKVGDIVKHEIPSLSDDLTASNFGKIKSTAGTADYAAGIINMIFETIGMMAAFAARNDMIKDVILTGNLTRIPQAKSVFAAISQLCGLNFLIPENAVFATAIGAAITFIDGGTAS